VFTKFTPPEVICADTVPLLAFASVPAGRRTFNPSGVEIKQFGGITYDCPFHLRFTDFVRFSLLVSDGGRVISCPEILFGSKLAGMRTGGVLEVLVEVTGVGGVLLARRLVAARGATSLTRGGTVLTTDWLTWGARFMVGMAGGGALLCFSASNVSSDVLQV
jgi:hypothetical protein